MGNHVHPYYAIFSYFAAQVGQPLDWWKDKVILDFGGNCGNVLKDGLSTITPENYHCLDVSLAGLEQGKNQFPTAHWHHYNRYNLLYNFQGNKDEPFPKFDTQFDVILIFSVFTTTSKEEMVRSINDELLPLLKPGGMLLNTYLSLSAPQPFPYFLWRRLKDDVYGRASLLQQAAQKDYFYLIGDCIPPGKDSLTFSEEELIKSEQSVILSFYKDEVIKQLFPTCEIKHYVPGQIQHCMIIRK